MKLSFMFTGRDIHKINVRNVILILESISHFLVLSMVITPFFFFFKLTSVNIKSYYLIVIFQSF